MTVLNDEELEKVVGGLTNDEIINKINTLWPKVPEAMRSKIIEALLNQGPKAARRLAEKILPDWAQPMTELFK